VCALHGSIYATPASASTCISAWTASKVPCDISGFKESSKGAAWRWRADADVLVIAKQNI